MAREINFDEPLSEDDLLYVQQRPWLLVDAELLGKDVSNVREEVAQLASGEHPARFATELTEISPMPVEGEFSTEDNQFTAEPDNPSEQVPHEDTEDDYETLKVADLRNEIDVRNRLINEHNESLREGGDDQNFVPLIEVPSTAHKADLILILRESDQNQEQVAVFYAADGDDQDDSES